MCIRDSDKGNTFDVIMQVLQDELGYHVHYKVLDSKGWTCLLYTSRCV